MLDILCLDSFGKRLTYLTQWDLNQTLIIKDFDVTTAPNVHFCNHNSKEALVVESTLEDNNIVVKIPNILLQEGLAITIYLYMNDSESGGKTIATARIPVRPRPKPSDYIYVENTSNIILEMIDERISKALEKVENITATAEIGETVSVEIGENEDGSFEFKFVLPEGVYVGEEEPSSSNVWIDTSEEYESGASGGGGTGVNGKSAYEIALDNGFEGTEEEWLDSLKGADGEKGDTGTDGYSPVRGTDYWTAEDKIEIVEEVLQELNEDATYDNDSIPIYWLSALEDGAKSINTALCEAGRNKSAFLFYSDAHWNYGSQMSPSLLKYLYTHTGITKTFFGGDIVHNESTDYDMMKYLWDWRNQIKELPNHHSVVGNHDDGNATDNLLSEQYVYGYLLAAEETPDVVRGDKGMYYYIDNSPERTRYLFLDTAYKGVNSDQIDFVKNTLLTTPDGWHIVVISHIWHNTIYPNADAGITDYGVGDISSDASKIIAMLDAYNSRNGVYVDCDGWVEFCIGGHTHIDYDSTSATGIPIILVETDSMHVRSGLRFTSGTTTESSVNGIIADYDNHKIYVVRIGRGDSREVDITNYIINYTNVLPTAIDTDGTIYNGKGWKENTRWSSSGNAETNESASGIYITGYIKVSGGDVIRLKNITMPTGDENGSIVHFFKSFSDTNEANHDGNNLDIYNSAVRDNDGNLIEFTVEDGYEYIRIQCGGMDETSIITINEPIE